MIHPIEITPGLTGALSGILDQAFRSLVVVQDGRQGAGAGVVWRSGGVIVTNQHVVARGRARVSLIGGNELPTKILTQDADLDLAILQVVPPDGDGFHLPAASIAGERSTRVGEIVLAIGHPWGQLGAVSVGILSGIGEAKLHDQRRTITVLRTDARLAPGNSGGSLINASGNVIGINTMIVGGDLGVAIPSDVVEAFVNQALGEQQPEAA